MDDLLNPNRTWKLLSSLIFKHKFNYSAFLERVGNFIWIKPGTFKSTRTPLKNAYFTRKMLSPIISYQINGRYCFCGGKWNAILKEGHKNRFESCHERSISSFGPKVKRLFLKGRALGFQKVSITVENKHRVFWWNCWIINLNQRKGKNMS